MAAREPGINRDRLLDAALDIAERESWENLRLHQVAAACGIGLNDVRTEFREKDEIIDALFDRADAAMLQFVDSGSAAGLAPRERIQQLVLTWLESLEPHRRVTRQMIAHKLEFGHLHVQLPALLRISRTVQWIREGASLDAPLPRRAIEETALTAFFTKTFAAWLRDNSTDFHRTRQRLERDLDWLDMAARLLPGGRVNHGANHPGTGAISRRR